jgi:ABC-type multidrug transport system ATPase subunit
VPQTQNTYSEDLSTEAITLDRVSLLFGSFVALRDVSLTLPIGSSVVVLGENGAGKSTLLKLIAGLASPSYGKVSIFGQTPQSQRGRIATMGHATQLYDELTAIENLIYFAGLHGIPEANAAEALREVALDPANPRRVGEYSQGMKQRASLARALLTQPDLLLLDEPFSNLDVSSVRSMVDRLVAWVSGPKRTLLLTTHQAELARPLAPTTVTLNGGRLASVTRAEAFA